jgi:hypothetical protein
MSGANQGQSRYLYLSSGYEDALWFAQQKGCETVLAVRDVPWDALRVDPEDGGYDRLADELAGHHGLPGKVILVNPLPASHFSQATRPLVEASAAAKSKYLYHGSSIRGLLGIIADDELAPWGDDGYHRGVSLTRSRNIAEYFAQAQEFALDQFDCQGAVLVFDRARLEQQVKLAPVEWASDGSEKEERTIGGIKPAFASVIAINVTRADLEHYQRLAAEAVEDDDDEFLDDRHRNALRALLNSRLLRVRRA